MDLQVHLLIHLVDDIEMEGVVSARWMFFFERYMRTLKLNETFFFLCALLDKDYGYGPWIWDEARATNIIDGEKPQYNGVQVEFGE